MNIKEFSVEWLKNVQTKVRLGALIICGVVIIGVAMGLRSATCTWIERQTRNELVKGNQDCAMAIGAGVGAAAGLGAGATIGGVGVACCGTGIGIPVGVVCIALGCLFGAVGGGIGSAVGTPDHQEQIVELVTHTSPFVGAWVWMLLLGVGIALVVCGVGGMIGLRRKKGDFVLGDDSPEEEPFPFAAVEEQQPIL